MCDKQSNSEVPTDESADQLIDPSEIKQEPNIKLEPLPIGDLVEVPEFASCEIERPTVHVNEHEISPEQIKIEVKEENVGKRKKKSKAKGKVADKRSMNNQQRERSSKGHARNRKKNKSRNAKKSFKAKPQGKGLKQHKCQQCEFATKYAWNLKNHLLTHTGEKPFPCSRCSKHFAQKQNLQRHMKVHAEEFLFNCSVCLRGFEQKNEKMEHEAKCKTLRYECHLCKKSCGSDKSHLINHMRVHSGIKPFECQQCSKQFTTKCNLKNHIKLHDGPRSFRCVKCRQGFGQQNEVIVHEEECNRRTFQCYACGKLFDSHKGHLEQHMRIHTGDKPFKCDQCPKKYAYKYLLNYHQKIHSQSLSWKCVICRLGFPNETQWKAHQRNCNRRVYECCWCKKFFGSIKTNLIKHMTTHTGERAFGCEICGNRFTQKSNLTAHMNRNHNQKR